jgi:hypothetical protein
MIWDQWPLPVNCWYDSLIYETTCTRFLVHISLSIDKYVFCWFGVTALPAFQLNLIYVWIFPLKPSLGSLPYTNSYLPRSRCHVRTSLRRSFIQRIHPGPRLFMTFRNDLVFYSEGLLVTCPMPKLRDHPSSFVCGCLFVIFAATLHSWRPAMHGKWLGGI